MPQHAHANPAYSRNGLQAHSRKILFVATTTLYTSTAFYWAINIACMLFFDHLTISAASKIYGSTFSTNTFLTLRRVQERATPTALTINVSTPLPVFSPDPHSFAPATDFRGRHRRMVARACRLAREQERALHMRHMPPPRHREYATSPSPRFPALTLTLRPDAHFDRIHVDRRVA